MSDSEHDGEDGMVVDGIEEDNHSYDGEDQSNDDEDSHNDEAGESSGVTNKVPRQVYLPGHQMKEDESLVFDPSAYHMLHDIDSGMFECLINC